MGVIQRAAFGRYKNIFLSQEEYEQLCKDYPGRMERLIEEMSSYLAANGKAYQNCEAALRNWATRNATNDKTPSPMLGFQDYTCEEGESF